MARGPVVVVTITSDEADLKRGFKEAGDAVDNFGRRTSSVGEIVKGILTADVLRRAGSEVVQFGRGAVDGASDLAESESKVSVVFGEQAKAVQDWSTDSATAFGQSQQSALEAVGTYGNLFQAFGLGRDESANMSKSLVELAADLASFNNTPVDEALAALQSGMSGEQEPLRRFGISLSDARLKAEAMALGLITSTKDALDPAAKSQAAYSLIMKDSVLAQGDFARTSGGLANQNRIVHAQFENMQAQLGTKLIPAMLALTSFVLDDLIPAMEATHVWVDENWPKIRDTIINAVDAVRTRVQPILDFMRDLWARWGDQISGYVERSVGRIVETLRGLFEIIQGIFQLVDDLIHGRWAQVWEDLKQIVGGVITLVKNAIMQFADDLRLVFTTLGQDIVGIVYGQLLRVLNVFSTIFHGVRGVVAEAFDGVVSTVKYYVNFIIGIMNRLVGAVNAVQFHVNFNLPDILGGGGVHLNWDGLQLGRIPELAAGGIVRARAGGILARLGEGGRDEAVIPLGRGAGGVGAGAVYVTVNAGLGTDGRSVGEQIRQVLVQERLRGGPLGLG